MKRVLAVAAAFVVAAVAVPARSAHAQGADKSKSMSMHMQAPTSHQASITGTVVDVSCRFGQGLSGAGHKMCTEICSDRGLPLAVLGDDGEVHIPSSPAMPGDAQNSRLEPFAEQNVKISGKVFAAGGANAIQLVSIEATK